MLENLLNAVTVSKRLQHVTLLQGTKAYGAMVPWCHGGANASSGQRESTSGGAPKFLLAARRLLTRSRQTLRLCLHHIAASDDCKPQPRRRYESNASNWCLCCATASRRIAIGLSGRRGESLGGSRCAVGWRFVILGGNPSMRAGRDL